MKHKIRAFFRDISLSRCILAAVGSIILSFGMYNIHSVSGVTEGGTLGLALFADNVLHISPSLTSFVLNSACYIFGIRTLGKSFLVYSAVSASVFSLSYRIFECFPRVYPQIAEHPLLACILGAVFVGVGAGLAVRAGGAPCGDDALAMSVSARTKIKIQWVYLISDLSVLVLSLWYIPLKRIVYSLLTVVISGQIIGRVAEMRIKKKEKNNKKNKDNKE